MNIKQIIELFSERIQETIYRHYEYGCDTSLTDEDMLKMQIDWSLDKGNKEMFLKLSEQLKEVTCHATS